MSSMPYEMHPNEPRPEDSYSELPFAEQEPHLRLVHSSESVEPDSEQDESHRDVAEEIEAARSQVHGALTKRRAQLLGATVCSQEHPVVSLISKQEGYTATAPESKTPKVAIAEQAKKVLVTREARSEDVDQITALDLKMFKGAYGERPSTESVRTMMQQRLENVAQHEGAWSFIQEKQEVTSFMTGFRTDKPAEHFTSWEESTADGTLNGVIDSKGKYMYICNLTVGAGGNKDVLMGRMFAEAIKEGVEYGYFESRMPQFRTWATARAAERGVTTDDLDQNTLAELAHTYRDLTKEGKDGKQVPYDWMLRMYKNAGMELGPLVADAFKDADSLDFGVMCKAHVPLSKAPKLVRHAAAWALKTATRFPKLMDKIF